jgi:hypothetical protein
MSLKRLTAMVNYFTREGTPPIDKHGIKQTLRIEGLPRLDPLYHMIRFYDLPKTRSAESALGGNILTEFGQPQPASR